MYVLKAAVLYFAIVFGVGFVLGAIRTLWVAPRVGTRSAELIETPIMFVIIIVAARTVVQVPAISFTRSARLGLGFIALALMLLAEFGFVLWLRGSSIREYLATRDPVSGLVYYIMLGVLALMPAVVRPK